jgi:crossover junction endodeoxyribonuclease RuvC
MSAGKVLGLDPGSTVAGYALVRHEGVRVRAFELGAWRLPVGAKRPERLARLSSCLRALLDEQGPDVAAVEGLFHHKNPRSAFQLAEARGALLATLGLFGVPVVEYPPATVKKSICGAGSASKEDVRRALVLTVPGLRRLADERHPPDATDALAIAVCHVVHGTVRARVESGRR